ncbi:hypothetical protein FQR65_LT11250 [Abscondita terminalis]|nr:hypothetical protein FQR65_LT11250 [Abscondita terminalis]
MNRKTRTIDPIGWSLQDPFPDTVTIGTEYEEVYQLVSNLPAPMPAPLTVTYTGGSDFTVEDQCSGLFLVPGQTCNVTVRFTPSSAGTHQFQLTLHYFNDVVPLPVQTMTAEGSTTLIVGSVTQALPATTVVESIYPVIFTFQNVSGNAATNLDLQRNYPADFTEENNTCTTTLAAGASCIVQGSLIPSAPGNYEVAADLYYAESVTPASVSTSTDAIEIIVTGAVTTPLPDPTVVGDSFPVVFTYTNNSDLPATSVTITTDYPPGFNGTTTSHFVYILEFSIDYDINKNFQIGLGYRYDVLGKASSGNGISTFVSVDLKGRSSLRNSMNRKTRTIDPIGWSLQDPFPDTVTIGTEYEEVYQLVSNLPAPMPAPLTVTYTGGSDFTVEDQCSGLFLVPGQTCNVTVRFTPSSAGTHQFQLTLHYFNDVVPLPVQTMTAEGSTTLIVGSVTQALPATTVVESIYPVIFTFQNVSGNAATNLDLQRNYPADFTEENNTCTTTLAAGASCIVQGSLIPSAPGNYEVAADLYYAESVTPASVSTSTDAIEIIVTGAVTTPLPDPTVVGDSFPVVFTYTNEGSVTATSLDITPNYPPGFTQQSNTCSGSLPVGAACTVTGTLLPASAGNYTVDVSLAYAQSVNPVPLSTSTSAIVVDIIGEVSTPLPGSLELGNEYPVVFTYTNDSPLAATNLVFTRNYPTDFMPETNTCTSTLASNSSCAVSGTLIPSNNTPPGPVTVGLNLTYSEGSPIELTTESEIESIVVITGTVIEALPPTETASATPLPVVFQYTNDGNTPATGLNLTTNYPPEFTQISNMCTGTLAVGASCQITGNLNISATGNYSVSVTLDTAETSPVTLTTQTTIIAAEVVGSIEQRLPSSTVVNTEYPVAFLFTNEGSVTATSLDITPNYPPGFTQQSNTCSGSLPVGAACTVTGTLLPASAGNYTVDVSLAYAQSVNPVPLSTSTSAIVVDIIGEVSTPLPGSLELGNEYPVVFTYTNDSPLAATNLVFTRNYPTDFMPETNTCTSTLASNSSCAVSGTLIPSNNTPPGPVTVGLNLTYSEGSPIELTTESEIESIVVITGTVIEALPPTETASATPLPVVFQYTNDGNTPATGLNLTTNYPPEFTQISNMCTGTLAVGASCQITGNLNISATGNYSVSVTLDTAETSPVTLTTQTTIIAAEVVGSIEQRLPSSTVVNTEYPVAFLFTNEGAVDATSVNIVKTYPDDFVETSNTCGATLAASASCSVQGILTPTSEGTQTVGVTFSYAEGSNIPLSTSTTVGTLVLQGFVQQGFPDVTSPTIAYPLIFEYTNPNPADATGLNLSGTVPPGLNITSNTCTGTLAANSSCTIQASFTPATAGNYTAGVTLSYDQGAPISLNTYTVTAEAANTLLIAVGDTGFCRTSPTWTDWTNRDTFSNITQTGITFSPQLQLFAVVGNQSGNIGIVRTTRDGISYTNNTWAPAFLPQYVTWSSDLSQFLAVGANGGIATSANGINYVTQTSGVTITLRGAIWNSQFQEYVVVGNNGTILTSTNGIDWDQETSGTTDNLISVTWSPQLGIYVIATTNANNAILNSSDGITWTSPGISFPFFAPRSVTWSPLVNRFLIVGTSGSTGASSNGTTWTNEQTLVGDNINDVIWYNRQGRFYAVGNSTWVYFSSSGLEDMRSKRLNFLGAPNILAIAAGAFVP